MKIKLQFFVSERPSQQKSETSNVDMYLNLDLDTDEWQPDYHLTFPRNKKSRSEKKLPRRFGQIVH